MEELDLKELISIFMKRKVLIILVVIIFALLGAIYTLKFITPTYKSSTKLVLVQTGSASAESSTSVGDTNSITTTDVTLNSKLVDNYRLIASSESVGTKVIENLGLDMTYTELAKIISVSTISDTELIQITVEYTDPEMACKIATEVANVFIETVNQIYSLNNLHVLDAAKVDPVPSNIHLAKNIVIFAFVGAVLVSGYILLVNMLDTTVKNDLDIEKNLGVPVLASIVLTSESSSKTRPSATNDIYKMVKDYDENEISEDSKLSESLENTATLSDEYNSKKFEAKEHNNYNNKKKNNKKSKKQ